MKRHFTQNLVITENNERSLKSSSKCWICGRLFAEWDNKVRDNDNVTGRYRGSMHKDCNINLRLIKKIPVIFYNLRSYDTYLIMEETGKFQFMWK